MDEKKTPEVRNFSFATPGERLFATTKVNIRCSHCGTHSSIPDYRPKNAIPKCPKCGKDAYRI